MSIDEDEWPDCDHCHQALTKDANGFWIDPKTLTSDCPANDRGHEVNGSPA
jgi:hypothetical protein